MATKQIVLPDIGTVKLYKRRGSRSVRLSIGHDGAVRVTLPAWLPYQAGIKFAQTKTQWIVSHQQNMQPLLVDKQTIGKAHRLQLRQDDKVDKVKKHLKDNLAIVLFPASMLASSTSVQNAARSVSIRALRNEAEELLPIRLASLAKANGLEYKSVSIRHLKSRWGSCNAHKEITLNLFLMQLPWQLIDYVIIHELTHTKVMRHGKPFWDELSKYSPDAKQLRKQILTHKPAF